MKYDGTNTTTTDYSGGFIYENSNLSYFSSPEGRVVKNGENYEYQYSIADHQGNTRVVFSSQAPAPDVYTATFEDNSLTQEQSTFQNYPTGGNRANLELFDHTDFSGTVYSRSQLLNGGVNSVVGLAKSLKVAPGDTITAEVFVKYWNQTSTSSNLGSFASNLVGAFGLTGATGGEALKAKNALNYYGGIVASGAGAGSGSYGPKAFLNVLLFDQNYNFVDLAYIQVSSNADQTTAGTPPPKEDFERLIRTYAVKEPGYAFIYISNESSTMVDVFFDDMKITHQKGRVVQYNEYYPFGMQAATSWTRDNTKGNNFLYNGGTELNAMTGVYDLEFRTYDPVRGRMTQVDPMVDKYSSMTGYNYAFNSPMILNDPNGADVLWGLYTREEFDRASAIRDWDRANGRNNGDYSPEAASQPVKEGGIYKVTEAYLVTYFCANCRNDEGGVGLYYDRLEYESYFTFYDPTALPRWLQEAVAGTGNDQARGSGPSDLNKAINKYGFIAGTFFGGIETGFAQGVKSLESVRVLTGQTKNGAFITQSRNAVSLSNKSAYVTASKVANALKWGGRIFAGGIVAYNAFDLAVNGGTNRDVARFALQTTIAGIGFLGPIGFVASLGLTLIEVNGGFDWVYDNFDNTAVHKIGN